MAFILYLSIASAVFLVFCIQSLVPLAPLLSSQPCSTPRFSPNKLSGFQVTHVIFAFLKPFLKQLRLVPGLRAARATDSLSSNEGAFELPDVRLEMPVMVNRSDMESYERATCAPNNASPTSGANSLFLSAPVTEPLMLLLLPRPACPILPLGSVNVRNRFELLSPSECKTISLRTQLRAKASLQRKAKRVKRGVDESRKKKPSDLVSTTENAFKLVAKEVLHIEADAPSKWAAFCKDYNPIHVSAIAAKLFRFPGKVAHGNQVAASMIESIAAGAKTKTKDIWLDSDSASFMDVEFKRPMVVPLSLRVETAEEASKCRSKETEETVEAAYNQIET